MREPRSCPNQPRLEPEEILRARTGDKGINGIKAKGWGRTGQLGIRISRCKVAKISNGAMIAKDAPLRLKRLWSVGSAPGSGRGLSEFIHIFDNVHDPPDLVPTLPGPHLPYYPACESIVERSDQVIPTKI